MTEKQLDLRELEKAFRKVDPELFLLRNRGNGNPIFASYCPTTGLPRATQIAFIIRRGEGKCTELDGGALPASGVHDWGNGWGCAVLQVDLFIDEPALLQFAVVFAAELSRRCQAPTAV